MAELLDFSYDRLTPAQVRAAGRVGVIRYVASGRPLVSADRAEVDGYRQAGLTFCAVWQRGDERALGGLTYGVVDAADALAYCQGLGAADTDPVYFAVDTDVVSAGQFDRIVDYFAGVASVLGWARVGVYGEHDVLTHLRHSTPTGLFWQTTSYSAGKVAPFANLVQYDHDVLLAGKRVDFDRSLTDYYGQWGRMALKSSSRNGAKVVWVTLHTAEGARDVASLHRFFADPNTRASSHAGADDTQLDDGWVPYDRAAWTLRNGNPVSDNLEMCGFADWTRAEWLTHREMVRNAARWAAGRCAARGIPVRRLTDAQVAQRQAGIIDHSAYTRATGDGTHWDVGPGFPWDVFMEMVADTNHQEADMPLTDADIAAIFARPVVVGTDGKKRPARDYLVGAADRSLAVLNSVPGVLAAVERLRAELGDDEGKVLGAIGAWTIDLDDEDVKTLAVALKLDADEVARAVHLDLRDTFAAAVPEDA